MNKNRNRGGWPVRPRTIFDERARRESQRASDILDRAKTRLRESVNGDLWDAVVQTGDWSTTAALDILDGAMLRVNQTFTAANDAAKRQQ